MNELFSLKGKLTMTDKDGYSSNITHENIVNLTWIDIPSKEKLTLIREVKT